MEKFLCPLDPWGPKSRSYIWASTKLLDFSVAKGAKIHYINDKDVNFEKLTRTRKTSKQGELQS